MKFPIEQSDVIIGVDLQKDFMPGGTLPVEEGNTIVPLINDLMACFSLRVLTRDWHPANHISFSNKPEFRDLSWPPHCIKGTDGADFHPDLHVSLAQRIIHKGQNPNQEQYSGFQDTDLADWLQHRGIRRVFITGLATEYCVKNTALDAKTAGFDTYVIQDAVRGLNSPRGSEEFTWQIMQTMGIHLISSQDLACSLPQYAAIKSWPEFMTVAA